MNVASRTFCCCKQHKPSMRHTLLIRKLIFLWFKLVDKGATAEAGDGGCACLFPVDVQVCVHGSVYFCVLEFTSDEASYHGNDSSLPQHSCWSWGIKSVSANSVGGSVKAKWHRHKGVTHGRNGGQVIHTSSNAANGGAIRLWVQCCTLLYIVINTEVIPNSSW